MMLRHHDRVVSLSRALSNRVDFKGSTPLVKLLSFFCWGNNEVVPFQLRHFNAVLTTFFIDLTMRARRIGARLVAIK